MIPDWIYISQTAGTSGTTTITVSAGTNNTDYVKYTSLIANNTDNDLSESIDILQKAKGDIYNNEYLTFEILSAGTIYWEYSGYTSNSASGIVECKRYIQYSVNDGNWVGITSDWGKTKAINVNSGDILKVKGNNIYYGADGYLWERYNCFTSDYYVKFKVSGNIMSLIYGDDFGSKKTLTSAYTFYYLFKQCFGLVSAEEISLPATNITPYCYASMFYQCSSLVSAPTILPSKKLKIYCYSGMFESCFNLTTTPILPATTLADRCYDNMFAGCSKLTTAPELPATTLANYCYEEMFSYCTSLTTAPVLPATTLTDDCYRRMFESCRSLTTAPDLPATTLAVGCYEEMFMGCSSLVTAPSELPAKVLSNFCYNGMFRNCSSLVVAPILPAQTMVTYCYVSMFNQCSSLNYIKCLAVNFHSGAMELNNWVYGVASSGTFVKAEGVNWVSGYNGIPSGWTIINA